MKKSISLILAIILLVSLTSIALAVSGSDSDYIKEKGSLIVGITEFAPMDYLNEKGEWIGFDADMAKAFAASLGVNVEFVVIDWESKELELDSKNIDCIWNGMTLTDGVKKSMATSTPYCKNAQVVVVKAENAEKADSIDSISSLSFAVEAGSAGEECAVLLGFDSVSLQSQADALLEVASGMSDACIIDLLMAGAMIGPGTSYDKLAYTVSLNEEEYGVGFRLGSDLPALLDSFFDASFADGSLTSVASEYGVGYAIIDR